MSIKNSVLFLPLDYFALPPFEGDSLQLSRARALVGANLFIALLMIIGVLFIYAADSLGDMGNLFIWSLIVPGFIVNGLVPFTLRRTGWLSLCQHVTLLITFAAIVIGICTSGGPVLASNNQLMVMQAALSLFLLGIRGGLIWSAIVLLTQSFLYYLFVSGVDFPNIQPPEAATAGAIFNWFLAFCAIVSLILLIELSRDQLEFQRNNEQEKLRYMATHDGLTKLANRSLFEERLKAAIDQSESNDSKVLLLYLDLDKFKPINDEWGHDMGDRVLKIVAARLKATTRECDTVARLGGDEFAVVLPNLVKDISVNKLTESIYDRITQPINLHGKHFNIGCSIGICSYPESANSSEQLWQQADAAMYIAKKKSARWHIHNISDMKIADFRS
ncbi:GGDEF domain-containing protein [Oceanicoccus sagamiensis]|uniref:GGDEF domain-containing protein n=1 Tax=Oceanicoccus sagamiensis TaxID=716816 RepID=A0A1X9NCU8_9GAMM|nr:GGDEF domain-containing protein [Oceanicoccus sagamiensis]ARN73735.1 hypothetical protein BST96_06170 [Oceanicoccus sagamiensis]